MRDAVDSGRLDADRLEHYRRLGREAAFEERMTALEGGVGALAVASGQAAQTVALLNLAENGGHIVSSSSLYGGTYNQLHYTFPKLGVEVSFIDDPDDLDAWRAAIRPVRRLLGLMPRWTKLHAPR